jgi:uncharacterized membrane protein
MEASLILIFLFIAGLMSIFSLYVVRKTKVERSKYNIYINYILVVFTFIISFFIQLFILVVALGYFGVLRR